VTREEVSNTYSYTITFIDPATPTSLTTDYPNSYCSGLGTGGSGSGGNGNGEWRFDHYGNVYYDKLTHFIDPFNLQGTFMLSFNTTPDASSGNCSLCTLKNTTDTTTNIAYSDLQYDDTSEAGYFATLADPTNLKSRLENLTNIGADDISVTVTSPWNTNASSIYEGLVWSITFHGVSVQGDVPLIFVAEENIHGDELGLFPTSPVVEERVKGNHAGFKLKFKNRTSYCIGWDSPNSEFQHGDFRSWERNLAISPLLSGYVANAIVEKDENSLLWVLKFDDLVYADTDIRRRSHNFMPEIILDSHCDHAVGGNLSYSVFPLGLGGNLSTIDLVSPLPQGQSIQVGDALKISTTYESPGAEDKEVTVVEVVNSTRILVDPPMSKLSRFPFTLKRKIPSQKAIVLKKPCGKDSITCTSKKYLLDRNLKPVTNVSIKNVHAGSKEAKECSSRGICDRNSGLCKCFEGYVKDDCSSICNPDKNGNCQNDIIGI